MKTLPSHFLIVPNVRKSYLGLFKRFWRFVFGSLAGTFLVFVFTACNGGGGSGGSSNNGGSVDDDDPNRQYKLVFKESIDVAGVENGRGIALSPDQGDVYFTAVTSNHLGRLDRDNGSGSLTFKTLWKDGNGDGHGNTVNGLDGTFDLVVSPDGRHVYVTGLDDNALVRFSRDATGDLTFAQALIDGEGGVDGLGGATGLAISADGGQVYVAGARDNALTVFTRDSTTGAFLTRSAIFRDGTDGVDGLGGAIYLVISPDGANLYVTGNSDDAVAIFTRNPTTGALTFSAVLKDGSTDAAGNAINGLDGAIGLAVSRSGKNIYVVASNDHALTVFDRDTTTGVLTYRQVFTGGESALNRIDIPRYATVSADGKNLYLSSNRGNALVVFDRDTATGALTYRQAITNGDSDGVTVGGLTSPNKLVLSSDDRHLYLAAKEEVLHFSREVR